MRPNGTNNLLEFAGRITRGAESHFHDVPSAARVASDLRLKIERLQQAVNVFSSAQNVRMTSIKRLAMADKGLRTWLAKARLVVMLARGARWSESWIHTGFSNRRTRVPRRLDDRIVLARALVSFFARHPEYGVGFAEVTAARGRSIYERVVQSNEMLLIAKNDCMAARQQREAAETDLRNGVGEFVCELKTQFAASDSCWADFGLTPRHPRKGGLGRSPLRRGAPIRFVPHSAPHPSSIAAA
jgi:hypothetical protein